MKLNYLHVRMICAYKSWMRLSESYHVFPSMWHDSSLRRVCIKWSRLNLLFKIYKQSKNLKIRAATIAFPITIPSRLRPFGSTDLTSFFVNTVIIFVIFFLLMALSDLLMDWFLRWLCLFLDRVFLLQLSWRCAEEPCYWVGNYASQLLGSGVVKSSVGYSGQWAREIVGHCCLIMMLGRW